jgi:hypothetical protein
MATDSEVSALKHAEMLAGRVAVYAAIKTDMQADIDGGRTTRAEIEQRGQRPGSSYRERLNARLVVELPAIAAGARLR